MVKVELGKRDFVWISLLIILIGVGFVYGWGSSNPTIMGHSADEIEGVCLSNGTNCMAGNSAYTNCAWYTGEVCPVVGGVPSLMTGQSGNQIRCCGNLGSAPATCLAYGWTTYNTYCNDSNSKCGECGPAPGVLIHEQERKAADCTITYQNITDGECTVSCPDVCTGDGYVCLNPGIHSTCVNVLI